MKRRLIVNADDFGQSAGINEGIIEAFERGIVTSTSLMVHGRAALEAALYARNHPTLSLGLHVDLGEWAYRENEWIPIRDVLQRDDAAIVSGELSRQTALFRSLVGKEPSHIDSHQHVHRTEPARSVFAGIALEIGVPLRLFSNVHYCGAFYGQAEDGTPLLENISVEALGKLLSDLAPGVTELACHPATYIDFETMYAVERRRELEVLCDPRTREIVEANEIELSSFLDAAEIIR